ncbi:MAG: hypothetical protein A3F80_02060 [Candidatus Melainabacteria bacterium RIFCSPLOWO2_12_FULL_35_11]|nr:MAG: hypothetical protein A3F80_02060 [Candidatus Melainabacteria bacterium RIFCSPLOWO2_12_FULL_35_11]
MLREVNSSLATRMAEIKARLEQLKSMSPQQRQELVRTQQATKTEQPSRSYISKDTSFKGDS